MAAIRSKHFRKTVLTQMSSILSGIAQLVNDSKKKSAVLADAKHHASADEIPFELLIERAMLTMWQGFGTPEYHSTHTMWKVQDAIR